MTALVPKNVLRTYFLHVATDKSLTGSLQKLHAKAFRFLRIAYRYPIGLISTKSKRVPPLSLPTPKIS
jgi:hypothetical protein